MRITGGNLRSRKLSSPAKALVTRPTSDRVREATFSIVDNLISIKGSRVADVFGGTGALGIEALSRGAEHAIFFEKNRSAFEVLKKNIVDLALQDRCSAYPLDLYSTRARKILESSNLNLFFCDPPYAFAQKAADWLDLQANLFRSESLLVFECAKKNQPAFSDCWQIVKRKTYGDTHLIIANRSKMPPDKRE